MMNYKRKALAVALSLIGSYAPFAHADTSDDSAGTLDRVEITGSNIKRSIKQEQAIPMTIVKTEDLAKQGMTTVEQVVNSLASNQSSHGATAAVGASTGGASYASLRGLGAQYTLVLLDGRRIVNQPMDGYAVDLNAIPLSVIDRVEVVRDGASAIYGTDAIGGVINFITKKAAQGLSIGGSYVEPQRSGGKEKQVSVSYGYGNLAKDGYNIYGAFDYHKIDPIFAKDRDFATNITQYTKLSPNSFPANYQNAAGSAVVASSYPNCAPPYSVPVVDAKGHKYCGEVASLYPGITPEIEQKSGFLKGTLNLGEHQLSAQYMITQTENKTWVAPLPLGGQVTSPTAPGQNPAAGPFPVQGRAVPLGDRVDKSLATTQRLQFNLEGPLAGWDYRAGFGHSQSVVTHDLVSGYVSQSALQNALNNGFDPNNPSAAAWGQYSVAGQIENAKSTLDMADFKVSKEIWQLPAGMLAVALGVEGRHETISHNYDGLASDALSTGLNQTTSASGSRSAQAVYGEMDIPVIKHLDANLAVRYDKYSDSGSSVNPKVSLKYQPVPQVMFRSSASTGFRAPTLFDINQPTQTQLTGGFYYNPISCPNGVGTNCSQQQQNLVTGGNKNLQPEKSSSLSFGVVLEPIKSVTLSADLWWTVVKNSIGTLDETVIFGNPAKYASLFSPSTVTPGTVNAVATTANLGNTSVSGLDVSFSYALPKNSLGDFVVSLDGTYISKYSLQLEPQGQYFDNAGRYFNGSPVFRWQHNLSLNWSRGDWSAILAEDYKSGYTDQYDNHMVKPYSTWNLSGTYTWNKKLSVTAGVRNLFDQLPPWSNQSYTTPQGYDPRFADATGRAYFLKANYKM
ncbi:TonB-dependent receptor [Chromobacterium vaccinii]|uniref:TonB-dependent receptor n=1 Tax=Chromobacterium vaccinii TaxID=1108595 RepID=UPI0021B2750D|nr:TonB-dependent receptor [Chromobacterium vaccinii]